MSTLARRTLAIGATAAVALIALAVPASAHVPFASADCVGPKTVLKVDAVKYDADATNTVKVVEVTSQNENLIAEATFKTDYHLKKDDFDPTVAHAFKVSIKASNDPDGTKGWSKTFDLKVKACKKDKPPSSEPTKPTSSTTTTTTTTAPPAPPTTTTTEAPVGANANLAATGASIAIPIAIGGLLLVGGATMLLILRRRRRA